MSWNLQSKAEKKRLANLLKLALFSWLCMGLLLGIYYENVIRPFCGVLWLSFVASGIGTIILGMSKKTARVQSGSKINREKASELREFQKII